MIVEMDLEENRTASFESYLFWSFASQIISWDVALMSDIYALGFLIHFEKQDLRYGTVGLVHNTNQQYRTALAAASVRSLEADAETKWHFEDWHQHNLWVNDELPLVAKGRDPRADPLGVSLRRTWLLSQGLWYTDEEEETEFDRTLKIAGLIESSFYDVCVRVASRLHTEGYTRNGNKGALPIVFHNYYYDDVAAECTHRANPTGIAEDFEHYILVIRRSPTR